jgi:hypothetical protein
MFGQAHELTLIFAPFFLGLLVCITNFAKSDTTDNVNKPEARKYTYMASKEFNAAWLAGVRLRCH